MDENQKRYFEQLFNKLKGQVLILDVNCYKDELKDNFCSLRNYWEELGLYKLENKVNENDRRIEKL